MAAGLNVFLFQLVSAVLTTGFSLPRLTADERKYADELIDHYALAWERSRRTEQPQQTARNESVDATPKDSSSSSPEDDDSYASRSLGIEEILNKYNKAWQKRQLLTSGGSG